MDVAATTTTAGTTGTTAKTNDSTVLSSDFNTFLKMLTTQMQNQDPLNPIDSSDYAVQLATFSGVEQQVRTNQLLETLGTQMGGSGLAQYSGWVGMDARVTAPVAFDGGAITLNTTPATGADSARLVIRDAQDTVVGQLDVTPTEGEMVWSGSINGGGTLPAGSYSFALESYADGQLIGTGAAPAYGRILEVRTGAAGAALVLEGGAEVAPTDITALRSAGG